uniref:Uncharacterized protein n=1 Tax=Anguilla anguilla TaxID=7936 RepID=A0A0E9SKM0_ANGAN
MPCKLCCNSYVIQLTFSTWLCPFITTGTTETRFCLSK